MRGPFQGASDGQSCTLSLPCALDVCGLGLDSRTALGPCGSGFQLFPAADQEPSSALSVTGGLRAHSVWIYVDDATNCEEMWRVNVWSHL